MNFVDNLLPKYKKKNYCTRTGHNYIFERVCVSRGERRERGERGSRPHILSADTLKNIIVSRSCAIVDDDGERGSLIKYIYKKHTHITFFKLLFSRIFGFHRLMSSLKREKNIDLRSSDRDS